MNNKSMPVLMQEPWRPAEQIWFRPYAERKWAKHSFWGRRKRRTPRRSNDQQRRPEILRKAAENCRHKAEQDGPPVRGRPAWRRESAV